MDANIIVYGTDTCEDTRRTREFLDSRHTSYRYVNIDNDPAAEQLVKKENNGKRRTPLVQFCIGTECRVLRAPTNDSLEAALLDIDAFDKAA